MPYGYKRDECKICRKYEQKNWWKKNWPIVVSGVVTAWTVIRIFSGNSQEIESEKSNDDGYKPQELSVHEPGQKYWNPNRGTWEKDGNPYTYRVSYKDRRDDQLYTKDYVDIDNGYEDYQYYDKQWYTDGTSWDHIPPNEE